MENDPALKDQIKGQIKDQIKEGVNEEARLEAKEVAGEEAKEEAKEQAKEAHEDAQLAFNTAPNYLTLVRVLLVPVVVAFLFMRDERWDVAAGVCFAIAGITDYFDGYLARRQKIETVFGKLMDPLADKFLVACSLIALQELGRIHAVVVMLLICREIAITGLRAVASAEGLIISASRSAKWKTATQMVAIPWIMARSLWGIPLFDIGMGLLYVSLAISLWSAKDYIVDFFRAIHKKRLERREERREKRRLKREAKRAGRAD